MKIDLVFLIVLGFVVAYVFALYKIESMIDLSNTKQIEHMADVSDAQIAEAVKRYYLSDEFIKNISIVSAQLQTNGLTVPGNLITKGPILIDHDVPHPDNSDGAFYRAEGQVQIATDDLLRLRHIGSKTTGIQFDVRQGTGDIQNPNGQMKISRQGIMFGGTNTDREFNSGQISAGLHVADSLNIVGMSNKDKGSRRVDMWAEGGFNVYGPIKGNTICLGGTCIDESNLQMLTGARGVSLKHLSGGHLTELADKPWVHAGQDRVLSKWFEASKSNFALVKN